MGGWKFYTHALDRDTIFNAENELKRIDLQLMAMVGNAAEKLSRQLNAPVNKKIYMFGFSASAHFVDRFSRLHP